MEAEVNYFLKLSVIHCKYCSSLIDNDIIHHDELILLYDKLVTTVLFRKKRELNHSSVFGLDPGPNLSLVVGFIVGLKY